MPGRMSLVGNVNNPEVLLRGTPEMVESQARYAVEAGVRVVAPECAVPLVTPQKNLSRPSGARPKMRDNAASGWDPRAFKRVRSPPNERKGEGHAEGGISPLVSPELLAVLYRMGHGDEIVLADAHFPGKPAGSGWCAPGGSGLLICWTGSCCSSRWSSDGDSPTIMMAPGEGSLMDPRVEESYRRVILTHGPDAPAIVRNDRFVFYERARKAFAVVMTGETATFGNIILRKGVTPS